MISVLDKMIHNRHANMAINELETKCGLVIHSINASCEFTDPTIIGYLDDMISASSRFFDDTISLTKEFFVNGEIGSNIKDVYAKLRTGNYMNNMVRTNDHIGNYYEYQNYLDGFSEFVKIVMGVKRGEIETSKINEKLCNVYTNDKLFVSNSFICYNESETSVPVSEAMRYIEYIPDIFKSIGDFKDEVTSLLLAIKSELNVQSYCGIELYALKLRACIMYISSIIRYISSLMKEEYSLFYEICLSLKRVNYGEDDNKDVQVAAIVADNSFKIL